VGSTPAGRIACRAGAPSVALWVSNRGGCPTGGSLEFSPRENSLSQCFEPAEQILLARNANDLVAQLAVLEKKQRRNRANVVLG
jgi:hypothetical protein